MMLTCRGVLVVWVQNKLGGIELDVCMLTQGYWPTQSVPPCM